MYARSMILAGAASRALAADSTCSTSVNATSQSDLDALSSCSSFDGSIQILGSDAGTLTLSGVESISGDLYIYNATSLTSFSAPSLESVNGTLKLQSLTILDTLSMPNLGSVGTLNLLTLPALQELQFNAGIQKASDVVISDTRLSSLDGLNLSTVDNFNINNNFYIEEISVAFTEVTELLDVSFNSNGVNVSFPDLKWANNATFRFCASVDMPVLEKINQSLGFINNTLYGIKCPKLATIGESLSFSSNSKLSNTTFSNLTKIGGGFSIANNTNLKAITGFPELKSIGGAIDFVGNFTTVDLPSLSDVEGGVYVSSSGDLDCDDLDAAHSAGDFHGDSYVCKGASTTKSYSLSGSATGSATDSSDSASATSGSSSSSKNAAPVFAPGASGAGLFTTVCAVLLSML